MVINTPLLLTSEKLHILLREETGIIFHTENLSFFKINAKTAAILRDILAGETLEACAACHQTPVAEIENFLQTLHLEVERQEKLSPPSIYSNELLGQRLILLVSQDCNLRCRYCNAAGGDYGQGRNVMSVDVAKETINRFIRDGKFLFREVEFFGGEPTLNLPVVRFVCEYLALAYEQKQIDSMPYFTLITNGLVVSDEFVEIVRRHNILVTVSVDGPQELHDQYRVDVGGQKTYQRIMRGVEKLRKATDGRQPASMEATVTRQHLDAGYTYQGLQKFFSEELGISRSHLALIECGFDDVGKVTEAERTQWLRDAHACVIDNLSKGEPKAAVMGLNMLKKLVFKRISPYLCPVGIAALTINVNGEIYPCYQLMEDQFHMGHVREDRVWDSPTYQCVEQRMRANDKFNNPFCQSCWARGVCSGCLGELHAQTGSIENRMSAICEGIRGGLEDVLFGLARLRSNPAAWAKITKQLQETNEMETSLDIY